MRTSSRTLLYGLVLQEWTERDLGLLASRESGEGAVMLVTDD